MKTKISKRPLRPKPKGARARAITAARRPKHFQAGAIKAVLVPIDFSKESKEALHYAVPFAERFGAKITLLYVVEPVGYPDFAYFPLNMDDEKAMKLAKGKLDLLCKQQAIDPALVDRTVARKGKAFHEITEAARVLKSDVIIISTHGYTGLKHALLGSTTERVVRHASCPVLVVRSRGN